MKEVYRVWRDLRGLLGYPALMGSLGLRDKQDLKVNLASKVSRG